MPDCRFQFPLEELPYSLVGIYRLLESLLEINVELPDDDTTLVLVSYSLQAGSYNLISLAIRHETVFSLTILVK